MATIYTLEHASVKDWDTLPYLPKEIDDLKQAPHPKCVLTKVFLLITSALLIALSYLYVQNHRHNKSSLAQVQTPDLKTQALAGYNLLKEIEKNKSVCRDLNNKLPPAPGSSAIEIQGEAAKILCSGDLPQIETAIEVALNTRRRTPSEQAQLIHSLILGGLKSAKFEPLAIALLARADSPSGAKIEALDILEKLKSAKTIESAQKLADDSDPSLINAGMAAIEKVCPANVAEVFLNLRMRGANDRVKSEAESHLLKLALKATWSDVHAIRDERIKKDLSPFISAVDSKGVAYFSNVSCRN